MEGNDKAMCKKNKAIFAGSVERHVFFTSCTKK